MKNNNQDKTKIQESLNREKVIVYLIILIISLVFIGIIVGFDITIVNKIKDASVNGLTREIADSAFQSTLLANGLVIIEIAVAVWAGLNVVTSLDRKDVDKLNYQVSILNKEVNQIEVITKKVEPISKNLEYMFTGELYNSSKDLITVYFYQEFNKIFIDNKPEKEEIQALLPELLNCEQIFSQVYQSHHGFNKEHNKQAIIIELIEEGLKTVQVLKKMNCEIQLIKKYIIDREGDFYFYKGYLLDSNGERYDSYIKASELYIELLNEFGYKFPDPNNIVGFDEKEDSERRLFMYLINSIGEAYSCCVEKPEEIKHSGTTIEKSKLIKTAQNAITYLDECVKHIGEGEAYEVYWRNRGCAHERLERLQKTYFEDHNNIIESYKNSLLASLYSSEIIPYRLKNIYYVNCQYLYKYLKNKLSFCIGEEVIYVYSKKDKELKERKVGIIQPIKAKKYKKIVKEIFEKDYEYIYYFGNVLKMAQTEFPREPLYYKIEGMWLLFIVRFLRDGVKIQGFEEDIEVYKERLRYDFINSLNLWTKLDDYFLFLQKNMQDYINVELYTDKLVKDKDKYYIED